MLLKTIWRYWNCFLSPVATDGMDGNGLKLEKTGQFFQVLMLRVSKIAKKFIIVSPLWWNSSDIFAVALQKHFVHDQSLKVMILARNWPKTAKSSWHCSFKNSLPTANLSLKHYLAWKKIQMLLKDTLLLLYIFLY